MYTRASYTNAFTLTLSLVKEILSFTLENEQCYHGTWIFILKLPACVEP